MILRHFKGRLKPLGISHEGLKYSNFALSDPTWSTSWHQTSQAMAKQVYDTACTNDATALD